MAVLQKEQIQYATDVATQVWFYEKINKDRMSGQLVTDVGKKLPNQESYQFSGSTTLPEARRLSAGITTRRVYQRNRQIVIPDVFVERTGLAYTAELYQNWLDIEALVDAVVDALVKREENQVARIFNYANAIIDDEGFSRTINDGKALGSTTHTAYHPSGSSQSNLKTGALNYTNAVLYRKNFRAFKDDTGFPLGEDHVPDLMLGGLDSEEMFGRLSKGEPDHIPGTDILDYNLLNGMKGLIWPLITGSKYFFLKREMMKKHLLRKFIEPAHIYRDFQSDNGLDSILTGVVAFFAEAVMDWRFILCVFPT